MRNKNHKNLFIFTENIISILFIVLQLMADNTNWLQNWRKNISILKRLLLFVIKRKIRHA